jgi:hypothetical protein
MGYIVKNITINFDMDFDIKEIVEFYYCETCNTYNREDVCKTCNLTNLEQRTYKYFDCPFGAITLGYIYEEETDIKIESELGILKHLEEEHGDYTATIKEIK